MTTEIYSWNTTKTDAGFRANVTKLTPRNTPNDRGHYSDHETVQTAIFKTRAQAKGWAQKWVRYMKHNAT